MESADAAPLDQASKQQSRRDKKQKSKQQKQPKQQQQGPSPATDEKGSNPPAKTSPPQPGELAEKSREEVMAERKAKKEKQKAAKQAKIDLPSPGTASTETKPQSAEQKKPKQTEAKKDLRTSEHIQLDDVKVQKKLAKKLEKQQVPVRASVQKIVSLFGHLPQYERGKSVTQHTSFKSGGIHPAIIKLGIQYSNGVVCGSNARCMALLSALKQVIHDYITPPHKYLSRDLEAKMKPNIAFIRQCRPLSVSMGNAIKFLKMQIHNLSPDLTEAEAKTKLNESIRGFVLEKIELAQEAISTEFACKKINDKDVILVYGYSTLILKILADAQKLGKSFSVVVVDARPHLEGKIGIARLVEHGIPCTYVLINSISFIMQKVTKVFMGAHALLANGSVKARVGSSQVAMVAKAFNVPVLFCCETYKFSDRVQTDSFVFNELGDPNDLVKTPGVVSSLTDWKNLPKVFLLNLVYDVTPADLVTMVITELGMLPCTSVPVVLRVKYSEVTDS